VQVEREDSHEGEINIDEAWTTEREGNKTNRSQYSQNRRG